MLIKNEKFLLQSNKIIKNTIYPLLLQNFVNILHQNQYPFPLHFSSTFITYQNQSHNQNNKPHPPNSPLQKI